MFCITKPMKVILVCLSTFMFNGYAAETTPNTHSNKSIQTKEDIVVLTVHKAIRDNSLSQLRDHCIAYDYDESSDPNYFIVDVREDKRYAICGGDPDTSVHLFRFKVSRKDYSLMTDAGSDDGSFHSIKK
jgi:hypothetical protein